MIIAIYNHVCPAAVGSGLDSCCFMVCALSVNEEGSSHLPTAEVRGPDFEGELLETSSMG